MNRSKLAAFIKSDSFPKILIGIGIALGVIVVFEAGFVVGHHEAEFSARWGQNYEQNFGGPGDGDDHEPMANGALGRITEVSSSTLILSTPNSQEQRVTINGDTIIRDRENTVTTADLSNGTYVVVVGVPDDRGEIDAKLIRVVPTPDGMGSSTPNQ